MEKRVKLPQKDTMSPSRNNVIYIHSYLYILEYEGIIIS